METQAGRKQSQATSCLWRWERQSISRARALSLRKILQNESNEVWSRGRGDAAPHKPSTHVLGENREATVNLTKTPCVLLQTDTLTGRSPQRGALSFLLHVDLESFEPRHRPWPRGRERGRQGGRPRGRSETGSRSKMCAVSPPAATWGGLWKRANRQVARAHQGARASGTWVRGTRERTGMTVPSTDAGFLDLVPSPFGKSWENSQPGLCWAGGLPTRRPAGVPPRYWTFREDGPAGAHGDIRDTAVTLHTPPSRPITSMPTRAGPFKLKQLRLENPRGSETAIKKPDCALQSCDRQKPGHDRRRSCFSPGETKGTYRPSTARDPEPGLQTRRDLALLCCKWHRWDER